MANNDETPQEAAVRIVEDVLYYRASRGCRHSMAELRSRNPWYAGRAQMRWEYHLKMMFGTYITNPKSLSAITEVNTA